MIAHGERKRQSVFHYDRITADISLAAHPAELVHARVGADVRPVSDSDMTGESRGVGHDYLVAEKAIVRDVRLRHDEAVVAGFCDPAAARRAAMNRHELANPISPANFRSCGGKPIETNGKISVSSPILVRPSMTAWPWMCTPSPSMTSSPTTAYGPIRQFAPIRALGLT